MDFKDLNDIANYINKGKEDYEIDEDPIIEDLVNSFEHIGLLDHVYAFNDDVHCLRNISDELKKELKFSLKKREENLKLIEHLYYQKSAIKSKIYL